MLHRQTRWVNGGHAVRSRRSVVGEGERDFALSLLGQGFPLRRATGDRSKPEAAPPEIGRSSVQMGGHKGSPLRLQPGRLRSHGRPYGGLRDAKRRSAADVPAYFAM